jgi:hypothetical protein
MNILVETCFFLSVDYFQAYLVSSPLKSICVSRYGILAFGQQINIINVD